MKYPDISHHHPVNDWVKVKKNAAFLISKATQGTSYVDDTLDSFIAGCEKNKLPYWLYSFITRGKELESAKFLVKTCKGKVGPYFRGYCLDVEKDPANGTYPTASGAKKALEYLESLGGKVLLYTGYGDHEKYKDVIRERKSSTAWWEARYGENNGSYSSRYPCHSGVDLHQFTSLGTCPGISGKCDLNRMTGTKDEAWFTGAEKTTVPAKKTVDRLIALAEDEVGYLEKKSNKDLDHKTKNAGKNNYTKYNAVFGVNGCYWCAYFICWLFYTLCGNNKADAKKMLCGALSGACETLRQAFIKQKRYYVKNPKVGDLVFFKGTRHAGANHIALAVKVTKDKLYTIEGNTSTGKGVVDNGGGVAKKTYALSDSKIMGYGRPVYEKDAESSQAKPSGSASAGGSISSSSASSGNASAGSSPSTNSPDKPSSSAGCYKKYTGKSERIDDVFKAVGVPAKFRDTYMKRKPVASKNGISNYKGSATQNLKLVKLAKAGKLKKV